MTVRRLEPEDGEAWFRLLVEGATLFPAAFLQTPGEARATPRDRLPSIMRDGHHWGVFEGDDLVGFASIRFQTLSRMAHRAYLGPFYIRPAWQGTGAAYRLLDGVLAILRESGIRQVDLWVAEANGRAFAFYERHGFVKVGRMPRAVIMEDTGPEADLLMVAMLDGADPSV
ncbi:GNAT family N-acetyltransferase [Jannaschia aquimarina]|uniref:MshD_2 protein n=1 Tax=Jannaschia aquimarina TaxID=935700 RepID=A0A0D1DAB1_9RHOB|nr:GNAT family N-acetyltransferase [Jannaschia aquimarina]KIT16818.1 Mycothiol acetyltransferase [Jannaschia aquimarina]SNT13625.1 Ribosomal protein S18 acetylase RimI [Jannaschia aquimarina]